MCTDLHPHVVVNVNKTESLGMGILENIIVDKVSQEQFKLSHYTENLAVQVKEYIIQVYLLLQSNVPGFL